MYTRKILNFCDGTSCVLRDPHDITRFPLILILKPLDSHDIRELCNLPEPILQGGGRVSKKVGMVRPSAL